MTAYSRIVIALAMCIMPVACAFAKKAKPVQADSLSEMLSVFIAENTKRAIDNFVTDFEVYGSALDAAALRQLVSRRLLADAEPLAYSQASEWISAYMDGRTAEVSARMLAAAAAEPDAQVLPSGVVIRILEKGAGAPPTLESTVSLRYTGSLPDGTVFDTIGPDDTPMRVRVGDLAAGLGIALTNMQAGATALVSIPAELAYGAEGIPGVIPPDSALRFEIELIDIHN